MTLSLLDTNVVLDIIYDKRNGNNDATNFYKGFKNYELSIEDIVNKECYEVVNKKSLDFVHSFKNFIIYRNKIKKNWDYMNISQRRDLLKDFLKNTEDRKSFENRPFYTNIIGLIGNEIIYMDTQDVLDYLLELPGKIQDFIYNALLDKFSIIHSLIDIIDPRMPKKFLNLKGIMADRGYFKQAQKNDSEILLNMIYMINNGTSENNKVNFIHFYTMDLTFIKIFDKIKLESSVVSHNNLDECFKKGIDGITFRKPYHN